MSRRLRNEFIERRPMQFPRSEYGVRYIKRGQADTLSAYGLSKELANPQQLANRIQDGWTGRGAYRYPRRARGRYQRSLRGRGLYMGGKGGYWAQKFGFKKGGLVDRLADKITPAIPGLSEVAAGAEAAHKFMTGQGEYHANDVIEGSGAAFEAPRFAEANDGGSGVVITHREYLGDVYGPDADHLDFSNRAISINPGIEQCFPWLSQIAMNYEEYELLQCVFTFRSTTTDIGSSTTGQCGTVIMATQYDVSDEPFSSKSDMLRYALAESCKSTEHMIHGVECDPDKLSGSPGKYVRTTPVDQDSDLKDYDHGVLNIATANIPSAYANQSLGELWISYTVKLRKPKMVSAKAYNVQQDIFWLAEDTQVVHGPLMDATGGISPSLLYGQQNSIGCVLSVGDATTGTASQKLKITFPANYSGNIEIVAHCCMSGAQALKLNILSDTKTGNVVNIDDMYTLDGANIIASSIIGSFYDSSANEGTYSVVSIWHVRVDIATAGVDNSMEIYYNWKAAGVGTDVLKLQYLRIGEYNTIGNFKQDGSNDAPVLVNSVGTITNPLA